MLRNGNEQLCLESDVLVSSMRGKGSPGKRCYSSTAFQYDSLACRRRHLICGKIMEDHVFQIYTVFCCFGSILGQSFEELYRGLATCCFCHGVELARGNRNLHLFQCCQGHRTIMKMPCQKQFIRFLSTNVCCGRVRFAQESFD